MIRTRPTTQPSAEQTPRVGRALNSSGSYYTSWCSKKNSCEQRDDYTSLREFEPVATKRHVRMLSLLLQLEDMHAS